MESNKYYTCPICSFKRLKIKPCKSKRKSNEKRIVAICEGCTFTLFFNASETKNILKAIATSSRKPHSGFNKEESDMFNNLDCGEIPNFESKCFSSSCSGAIRAKKCKGNKPSIYFKCYGPGCRHSGFIKPGYLAALKKMSGGC